MDKKAAIAPLFFPNPQMEIVSYESFVFLEACTF